MLHQSSLLCMILAATFNAAETDEPEAKPRVVAGWGHVIDPWRDCDVSLDHEQERLIIQVPGTPHVLSAEVSRLPMNAPRVVRRVRGDFTATVRVLGRLEPGRTSTTHYNPYHGAGLIVWLDPSNYLRLEKAVGFINGRQHHYINYELRERGLLAVTRGFTIEAGSLDLELRRQGATYSAWYSRDGRRWSALGTIEAPFAEHVDVGVVAVNSSTRTLIAELEMLNVEDPRGSQARDDADPEPKVPMPPPPPEVPMPPPPPAPSSGPEVRPKRMSVLFDTSPRKKAPSQRAAPIGTEPTGFHW